MIPLIKDLIKSSDYFGRNVELIFNNKAKFSTYLGGYLSLTILALTIILILNLGQELYERKSPKTTVF